MVGWCLDKLVLVLPKTLHLKLALWKLMALNTLGMLIIICMLHAELEWIQITFGSCSFFVFVWIQQITFKVESQCKTLCKKKYSSGDVDKMKKLDFLRNGIALNYQNHWWELQICTSATVANKNNCQDKKWSSSLFLHTSLVII